MTTILVQKTICPEIKKLDLRMDEGVMSIRRFAFIEKYDLNGGHYCCQDVESVFRKDSIQFLSATKAVVS